MSHITKNLAAPKVTIFDCDITVWRFIRLLCMLCCIIVTHCLLMVLLEKLTLQEALWLTLTSITTVGYGDVTVQSLSGRIATVVLIYCGGIAVLTQTVGLYFEYRQILRYNVRKGQWRWKMKNHIVFLHCDKHADEEYFFRAISALRESATECSRLQVVLGCMHSHDTISDRLHRLGVAHVSVIASEDDMLDIVSASKAHTIAVLAKYPTDPISDSINFAVTHKLREICSNTNIIVECVDDNNRDRIIQAGANHVLRPIRAYPELLIRSIISPGSEKILEDLFNSSGDECIRYEVETKNTWAYIVQQILVHDVGIAIAYENMDREIINNPYPFEEVHTKAIFVIVKEKKITNNLTVSTILESHAHDESKYPSHITIYNPKLS